MNSVCQSYDVSKLESEEIDIDTEEIDIEEDLEEVLEEVLEEGDSESDILEESEHESEDEDSCETRSCQVLTRTTYESIRSILENIFPGSVGERIFLRLKSVRNIDVSRRYLVDLVSIVNRASSKELREAVEDALVGRFSTESRFYKNLQKDYSKYTISEKDIKEGAITCSRCGSRKTISHTMQTRSADEGQTAFITCIRCKARWTMN